VIYEALGRVKQMAREGRVRNKAALFVQTMKSSALTHRVSFRSQVAALSVDAPSACRG